MCKEEILLKNPFFSIVMPIYNAEKYLGISIESVINQTFDRYEIILINDGSTDRSKEICNYYASKYFDKIKVRNKKNGGQLSARIEGLRNSIGKYIIFLDADDFLRKDTLERIYKVIEESNDLIDVISYRWRRVDQSGSTIEDADNSIFEETGAIDKETYVRKILSSSLLNSLCLKCCRLELFDLKDDMEQFYCIKYGEDLLQSIDIIEKARYFYYINEDFYYYRTNSLSISNEFRKDHYLSLNTVRPKLLMSLYNMNLASEYNLHLFFTFYLNSVWDNIVRIYDLNDNLVENEKYIDEIREFECVMTGKKYIKKYGGGLFSKIGLKIFYKGNNKRLYRYVSMYLRVSRIKKRIL